MVFRSLHAEMHDFFLRLKLNKSLDHALLERWTNENHTPRSRINMLKLSAAPGVRNQAVTQRDALSNAVAKGAEEQLPSA